MEDFEGMQFITIDYSGDEKCINSIINDIFTSGGFDVKHGSSIDNFIKHYFQEYMFDTIYQIGSIELNLEVDKWKFLNKPTTVIQQFVFCIESLLNFHSIKRARIIINNYACKNETENLLINISPQEIINTLFLMSSNSIYLFNAKEEQIMPDNMIIDIDLENRRHLEWT